MPDILRVKQWKQAMDSVIIPDWGGPVEAQEILPEEIPDPQEIQTETEPEIEETNEEAPLPELSEEELRVLFKPQWEALRPELERRAYRDAVAAARARLESCLNEMNRHLANLDEIHDRFLKEYAESLKYLAVDIAEKWILTRLESNDQILENLVMQAVADVKNAKWMDIKLSEKMVRLAETIEKDLEAPEFAGRVQISAVDSPVGTCMIHTDVGDMDASIQTQARQLKKVFQVGG